MRGPRIEGSRSQPMGYRRGAQPSTLLQHAGDTFDSQHVVADTGLGQPVGVEHDGVAWAQCDGRIGEFDHRQASDETAEVSETLNRSVASNDLG